MNQLVDVQGAAFRVLPSTECQQLPRKGCSSQPRCADLLDTRFGLRVTRGICLQLADNKNGIAVENAAGKVIGVATAQNVVNALASEAAKRPDDEGALRQPITNSCCRWVKRARTCRFIVTPRPGPRRAGARPPYPNVMSSWVTNSGT